MKHLQVPVVVTVITAVCWVQTLAASNEYLQHGSSGTLIVGGEAANPNEFPYQLSLRRNGRHVCGAVLVFTNKAVTSARCVEMGQPSDFKLIAGDHSLQEKDASEQERQVTAIHIHETYDPWTQENDIAVLVVSPNFYGNDNVRTMTLPPTGQIHAGDAVVTGWGWTDSDQGFLADVLHKGQVKVISNTDCSLAYENAADIPSTAVCAGTDEGLPDACVGDNGGPLVCTSTGSPYLCGIFSWGNSLCNMTGRPGVYTDLAYFSDWITQLPVV